MGRVPAVEPFGRHQHQIRPGVVVDVGRGECVSHVVGAFAPFSSVVVVPDDPVGADPLGDGRQHLTGVARPDDQVTPERPVAALQFADTVEEKRALSAPHVGEDLAVDDEHRDDRPVAGRDTQPLVVRNPEVAAVPEYLHTLSRAGSLFTASVPRHRGSSVGAGDSVAPAGFKPTPPVRRSMSGNADLGTHLASVEARTAESAADAPPASADTDTTTEGPVLNETDWAELIEPFSDEQQVTVFHLGGLQPLSDPVVNDGNGVRGAWYTTVAELRAAETLSDLAADATQTP